MARKVKRPATKKAGAKKPAKAKSRKIKPVKKTARKITKTRKTTAAKKAGKGFVRRIVEAIAEVAAPILPGSATEKPKTD
jgi:hypothetical protein